MRAVQTSTSTSTRTSRETLQELRSKADARDGPILSTLLELVLAVSEYAESEAEVIATVQSLVRSGKVRLCGNFRGERL